MTESDITQFDYKKVAKLDTDMWLSYSAVNRNSARLFIRALKLIKYQLQFSWLVTIKLAYYAGMAAASYRLKIGKENYPRALNNLTKLFRTVSNHSLQPFNYKKAAELELEWWDIQRYPEKYSKGLDQSLSENMATVFNVSSKKTSDYGLYRAKALALLHHHDKKLNEGELSELLLKAWKSLHDSIQHED